MTLLSLSALEEAARAVLSPAAFAYISGGAGDGACARRNAEAWARLLLAPQIGRRIGALSTRCHLAGLDLAAPILVAPMAYQRLAHPEGERAVALAAAAQGLGMVLSCQTSCPLEQTAVAPFWFQLYLQPDPANTLALAEQARAAGAQALVVTMDAPLNGIRNAEIAAGFALPADVRPILLDALPGAQAADSIAALRAQAPGWEGFAALCAHAQVPVLAKGVMTPAAAQAAMAAGAAGVIVSNHGGRVLEGLPATADVLPAIRAALPQAPVLVDGGLRSGEDVFRALALGADAVLIGRPVFHALALDGARGASTALRRLADELAVTMGLMGCEALSGITPDHLWRAI